MGTMGVLVGVNVVGNSVGNAELGEMVGTTGAFVIIIIIPFFSISIPILSMPIPIFPISIPIIIIMGTWGVVVGAGENVVLPGDKVGTVTAFGRLVGVVCGAWTGAVTGDRGAATGTGMNVADRYRNECGSRWCRDRYHNGYRNRGWCSDRGWCTKNGATVGTGTFKGVVVGDLFGDVVKSFIGALVVVVVDGVVVGALFGDLVGLGDVVGTGKGEIVGVIAGPIVGSLVGVFVEDGLRIWKGALVGVIASSFIGAVVEPLDGAFVGTAVGALVGALEFTPSCTCSYIESTHWNSNKITNKTPTTEILVATPTFAAFVTLATTVATTTSASAAAPAPTDIASRPQSFFPLKFYVKVRILVTIL